MKWSTSPISKSVNQLRFRLSSPSIFADEATPDKLTRVTMVGFSILVFLTLFYRMQLYVFVPFSAGARFALGCLLYISVLFIQKKLWHVSLWFYVLAGLVLLTGFQTWLQSGAGIAVPATSRFANVMMLAPLASLLLTRDKNLSAVFRLFFLIAGFAYASLLFQYFGGSLHTLIGNYVAIRVNLYRYMTLVGEPNVGGMLAVLIFGAGILLFSSRIASIAVAGLSVTWVAFSISKASMIGLALSIVFCTIASKENRGEVFRRIALALLAGGLLLLVLGALDYGKVSVGSLMGTYAGEPTVFDDFMNRQTLFDENSASQGGGWELGNILKVLSGSTYAGPLMLIFGASFSRVGSAAQEILGPHAGVVLPHNSYLELFLTGGVAMLGVVLYLMLRAFLTLVPGFKIPDSPTERCALVFLLLLSFWMLVYPVIYEPITGSLFWIIIGYGNRNRASTGRSEIQT